MPLGRAGGALAQRIDPYTASSNGLPPMKDVLGDLAESFRSRSIDSWDPRIVSGEQYTSEHLGADGLTVEDCRRIARMRPIAVFMSLFATQVGRHGYLRRSPTDVGYEIVPRDPKAKITRATEKMAREISDALERGVPMHRKMQMIGRDSAEIDLAVGEITFSRGKNNTGGNKPYAWMPFDATTFRPARLRDDQIQSGHSPFYRPLVQFQHGIPVNVYAPEEVLWFVRRPRTDQHVQGWGYPEIVEAAETMATIIKANRFNDNFFENGTHARYFLKFKMQMSDVEWDSFKRQFQEQLKGLDNAHKIGTILLHPGAQGVSQAEDVEKVSLSESPKDMEFRWGYGFYLRELAAILGVDLGEVGQEDPADTGRSTMQEADRGDRILQARERRLEPALRAFADEFNKKFVQQYHDEFEIRFLGMGQKSAKELAELTEIELRTVLVTNEARARLGLKRLKAKWADEVPLNAMAVQLYQAEMAAAQAPAEGEDGAIPGGPPSADGPSQDENDKPFDEDLSLFNDGGSDETSTAAGSGQ
jgi:hypothetical protein